MKTNVILSKKMLFLTLILSLNYIIYSNHNLDESHLTIDPLANAINPSLPPSSNFDLTSWKITLPDQTEIKEEQISSGFESPDEFYTDPISGGMVFKCPNSGATGGSTYPRSELREMLRAGDTSISTQGIGLNNWVFSSSSLANQEASGGVDGTLTATVTVDHVSTTGDSNKVGRVIIGQIHASNNEPCRLYYRKLPTNSKGTIYIAHEPNGGSEQWYELIGSRSDSASDPIDGIALGEQFSYEIKVIGNTLTVSIMREGKPNVVQIVDMSQSGYENDWMYFKAGNYNQNNGGDAGDYAQVTFFELSHTHNGLLNDPPSCSITAPTNGANYIVGENININVDAFDSDGSITMVEFYQGNLKLGEDNTLPYSYAWNNVPEGNFVIKVVVTDDQGAIATAELSITVNPEIFSYGDVNHDSVTNIVDALLVAQFYVGEPISIDENLADVNIDGLITIVDALLIGQYYVGDIPSLPIN